MSTSNNPDLLMTKLNTKFAAWITEQLKTNPSADWSVAALEYTCHVENIAAAFKVEDPRVFEPTMDKQGNRLDLNASSKSSRK